VKPSPFTYHRPETVEEALAVLAATGDDGKVLAGGQSLLPILSMRLAAPGHLVDINRIAELDYIRAGADGVRVGALARHARVEADGVAAAVQPLLRQAVRLVAHPTIRNRGTTVGSIVHADPSAEVPAVLALTGGSVTLAAAGGRRDVPAAEFLAGPMEPALRPGEMVLEAFFPALPPGTGTAFVEVSRRHGDYAVCGVAAMVTRDAAASVAYISMAGTPVVVRDLPVTPGWADAVEAATSGLEPDGDIHATAAYRLHLARVLTGRALVAAQAAATAEAAA
jgi:carbon-monoxide dehydrogenase medium subunit